MSTVNTFDRSAIRQDPHPRTLDFSRYAVRVIFIVATVVHVLQVLTPFRLTSDGITYLTFADAANQAHGLSTIHQTYSVFPKGYSTFLFALMRLGVFSSAPARYGDGGLAQTFAPDVHRRAIQSIVMPSLCFNDMSGTVRISDLPRVVRCLRQVGFD